MKALLAFIITFLPAAALACSPALWPGEVPPTVEQVVAKRVGDKPPAFLGKVQIVSLKKEDTESTKYEMRVLKQYLGAPVETITAVSNETSSCAFYGKEGDAEIAALNINEDETFDISSMSGYFYDVPQADVEAYLDGLKAAGGTIPAPPPEPAATQAEPIPQTTPAATEPAAQ